MNNTAKVRVLFPEGSSLSARQALTALGGKNYIIDICDPNPMCICRFSKFVHRFFRCPAVGLNPIEYYQFILKLLVGENYDVLLPVHEQAFLFSRFYEELSKYTRLAVSNFGDFSQVQSKVGFMKLLKKLDIPHPESAFVKSTEELRHLSQFPCYVKEPYGTAGHGTWKVESCQELDRIIPILQSDGYLDGNEELLIQSAQTGILCVTQALFNRGQLIGASCYKLCAEGIGGSASAKVSVKHSSVIRHLQKIGDNLHWHGCIMLDYIYDEKSGIPFYIEANPRLGETMNATLSGFNLAETLIRLSMDRLGSSSISVRYGIHTHSLMAILLGIADVGGGRIKILSEMVKATFKRGCYQNSMEVLTNPKYDWLSVIPILITGLQLLLNPNAANQISSKAIHNYSLSHEAVTAIQNT